MRLALVGFILMFVLMYVLIREKMAPPVAFVLLPLDCGCLRRIWIRGYLRLYQDRYEHDAFTAILFVFSISYFTLMSDKGLFDPIIGIPDQESGKERHNNPFSSTAHNICGTFRRFRRGQPSDRCSGISFQSVRRCGIRPRALRNHVRSIRCYEYRPVGGPTMRAASVVGIEVEISTALSFLESSALVIVAFAIAFVVSAIEKRMAQEKRLRQSLRRRWKRKRSNTMVSTGLT